MKHSSAFNDGFSLVEVVIAMAVVTFCLIALLGLLTVASLNNASSLDQTIATSVAAAIMSDLRATPVTAPGAAATSSRYQIKIPAAGGSSSTQVFFLDNNGTLSGAIGANANATATPPPLYRATLTFLPPTAATPNPRTVTFVRILITWPGLAEANAGVTLPTHYIGSFDTVVGLDRN